MVFVISASGLAQTLHLPPFVDSSKSAIGLQVDFTTNHQTVRHWNHAFRRTGSQLLWNHSAHHTAPFCCAAIPGIVRHFDYGVVSGIYPAFQTGFTPIYDVRLAREQSVLLYSGLQNHCFNKSFDSFHRVSAGSFCGVWPSVGAVWCPGPIVAPCSSFFSAGLFTTDPCTGLLIPVNFCRSGCRPGFAGASVIAPPFAAPMLPGFVHHAQISTEPRMVIMPDLLALADPRVLDLIAPAMEMLPAANMSERPDPAVPLLGEFPMVPLSEKTTTAADRVESLLLQSQGDEAFRRRDYARAKLVFETALRKAPQRAAVWFRLMMLHVAFKEPAQAAACLKTALSLPADGTRAWVSAKEIYGPAGADSAEALRHSEQLWSWLAERPLSADRLLLLGTFQQVRGYAAVATEILAMASHKGAEEERVLAVRELAAFQLPAPKSTAVVPAGPDRAEVASPVPPASDDLTNRGETTASNPAASTGIVLRGKRKSIVGLPAEVK